MLVVGACLTLQVLAEPLWELSKQTKSLFISDAMLNHTTAAGPEELGSRLIDNEGARHMARSHTLLSIKQRAYRRRANAIAAALRGPDGQYRARVVPKKRRQSRKTKHPLSRMAPVNDGWV